MDTQHDDIESKSEEEKKVDSDEQANDCMDISQLNGVEHKWEDNATVLYYEKFLSEQRAQQLFDELLAMNYQQGEFKLFGKTVKTPRLQCWMRDHGITNKMAHLYQKQEGYDWSVNMLYVKHSIEALLQCKFNYVLINYYRDGKDYIAFHSDGEAAQKHTNVVASVSLGGSRRFVFRHCEWKKNKIAKKEFLLPSGSLVVMKDDTQKKWKHSIPKSAKPQKPRINLTFRQCCACAECTK